MTTHDNYLLSWKEYLTGRLEVCMRTEKGFHNLWTLFLRSPINVLILLIQIFEIIFTLIVRVFLIFMLWFGTVFYKTGKVSVTWKNSMQGGSLNLVLLNTGMSLVRRSVVFRRFDLFQILRKVTFSMLPKKWFKKDGVKKEMSVMWQRRYDALARFGTICAIY